MDQQGPQVRIAALTDPQKLTRPPVPDCRGTKPRKAANSRPERNVRASATVATTALAVRRPTPGIAAIR